MIYYEHDEFQDSLFRVVSVDGDYNGWLEYETWTGKDFTIYPNENGFLQVFLAPTVLGFWDDHSS